jgi:hypothetical protein
VICQAWNGARGASDGIVPLIGAEADRDEEQEQAERDDHHWFAWSHFGLLRMYFAQQGQQPSPPLHFGSWMAL